MYTIGQAFFASGFLFLLLTIGVGCASAAFSRRVGWVITGVVGTISLFSFIAAIWLPIWGL